MQVDRPTRPPFAWADDFTSVGTTGTNGKTSTTFLVAAMLRHAFGSCVRITTVGYDLDDEPQDDLPRSLAGFQELLRRGHDRGIRHAAIEATSLALSNGYAKRWRFDHAAFTNLSPDHLKTHGSWEHYLAAKAQLFVHLGPGRTAVLNAGDVHAQMIDRVIAPDVSRRWFHAPARGPAQVAPDLALRSIELSAEGTRIELVPSPIAEALGGAMTIRMVGEPFAENALTAALLALAAGVPAASVIAGASACVPVPGRFEVLARDPIVAVDYAHSPDALARTCDTARRLARGRVWLVFGAGGESTPDKRTPMGEAVGRRADVAIVTNDNPRREDPQAIAEAVLAGVRAGGRAEARVVLDRAAAIAMALDEAVTGDVVVVAGKGHEHGQIVGSETIPFSDVAVVRGRLPR